MGIIFRLGPCVSSRRLRVRVPRPRGTHTGASVASINASVNCPFVSDVKQPRYTVNMIYKTSTMEVCNFEMPQRA